MHAQNKARSAYPCKDNDFRLAMFYQFRVCPSNAMCALESRGPVTRAKSRILRGSRLLTLLQAFQNFAAKGPRQKVLQFLDTILTRRHQK